MNEDFALGKTFSTIREQSYINIPSEATAMSAEDFHQNLSEVFLYEGHIVDDSFRNKTSLVGHLFDELFNDSAVTGTTNEYDHDTYFYDYDESVNTIPFEEAIPVGLVYGVTLLLGLVGNVFVIVSILRYKRMQTVTNVFLTSLASADLLLVLLCVPIKLAKWLTFSWTFGAFLCKFVHYLQNISVICSIMTLTSLSLERYYAILHPMKAKYVCTMQRAKRLISVLWGLSLLLASPILYGQIQIEVGVYRKAHWCVKEWPQPWQSRFYELSMFMLIFVVPLMVMSFAYVSICREMMQMTAQRAMMGRTLAKEDAKNTTGAPRKRLCRSSDLSGRRIRPLKDDLKTRKQVINMLVAIIVLFALCWGPTLIDNVLIAFGVLNKLHYGYLKPMRMAFSLMAYSNSCVNPVVYAFMSKNFRTSFQNTLSALTRRRRLGSRGTLWRQNSLMSKPPTYSYPLSQIENSSMLPPALDLVEDNGNVTTCASNGGNNWHWKMTTSYS